MPHVCPSFTHDLLLWLEQTLSQHAPRQRPGGLRARFAVPGHVRPGVQFQGELTGAQAPLSSGALQARDKVCVALMREDSACSLFGGCCSHQQGLCGGKRIQKASEYVCVNPFHYCWRLESKNSLDLTCSIVGSGLVLVGLSFLGRRVTHV